MNHLLPLRTATEPGKKEAQNPHFGMVQAGFSSMLRSMKPLTIRLIYVLPGLLVAPTGVAFADIQPNPYQAIIERNPFGLKPPPPPVEAAAPVPITPPGKVILTGITTIFGSARALLEITEQEAGKTATTRKPILHAGERDGSVEVVSIDVEKSLVRVRNGNIETNLGFEVPKLAASAPAAPGGVPSPLAVPTSASFSSPTPSAPGRGSAVTVFGNSSASPVSYGGGGVTSFGGGAPASSLGSAASYGSGGAPASYGALSTPTLGASANGIQIPTRTLRTDAPPAQQQLIDPATQYLKMAVDAQVHAQAGHNYPPLPPPPP